VIPKCTAAQASTPGVECSNGPITFWSPYGRTIYNGLLARLDKRFSNHLQFTASYALNDNHGYGSFWNLNNYQASYGPTGSRHNLNISGVYELPWGFQIGLISAMATKGPVNPTVTNIDLTGSGGSTTMTIPGLGYNCLNAGCSVSDLQNAVNNFNNTYAGKKDARGQTISPLVLPSNFSTGRFFDSQDLRVTKKFTFRERYSLSIFGEMFNVLNYFNPSGYNFNIDTKNTNAAAQTFAFGQATQRVGQIFGSGGPRASQIGARFQF
jgi:hypothetical protein